MSDTENETTPDEAQDAPPTGDEAPPSIDPITPPEPTREQEPVGRTPEQESGQIPADGPENGVGLAPTQPGDVDDQGNGGKTEFQTTEQIENAGDTEQDDAA